MSETLLGIKNARIVDPVNGTDAAADLILRGPVIEKAGQDLDLTECRQVIDASGWIAAPGLVDMHVHFRDPGLTYKEDIQTGAAAAKKGGFTTVVMMANTKPPVSTPELVRANLEKGARTGIHILQAATVTKDLAGKELTDFRALADAGATLFSDDGIPILDEHLLQQAMSAAKKVGLPISLHEEDPSFIESPGVNRGPVSRAVGVGGATAFSEEILVARDLELARRTGACVVIQHISSGGSVDLVRSAKAAGADVHAEATPHHFSLTETAVLKYGTNARMNPPLRTEEDRRRILAGLADGTIDVIATDHAPHSAKEKAKPFADAPSGIIGLETSLALGVTVLVRGGILTMMQLMDRMSRSPAELCHLNPKGIVPGAPADLVLFAPDETFRADPFVSKASNSPFAGRELYAPVKYTICGGKIVYQR